MIIMILKIMIFFYDKFWIFFKKILYFIFFCDVKMNNLFVLIIFNLKYNVY